MARPNVPHFSESSTVKQAKISHFYYALLSLTVTFHWERFELVEVIMSGETPLDRQQGIDIVTPFQKAGATWWVEEGLGWTFEEFRERIRSGPPRR